MEVTTEFTGTGLFFEKSQNESKNGKVVIHLGALMKKINWSRSDEKEKSSLEKDQRTTKKTKRNKSTFC